MFDGDTAQLRFRSPLCVSSSRLGVRSAVGVRDSLELAGMYQKKDTLGVINVSTLRKIVIHAWTAVEWPKCGREHERKSTARGECVTTLGRKSRLLDVTLKNH
jgi:hypothetical protein